MRGSLRVRAARIPLLALALALGASAGSGQARAQDFPSIPLWSYTGAYHGPGADSVVARARTTTLRWLRDPVAEARPDFAGYRIYRVFNSPDTSRMVLVRRFSINATPTGQGDALFMWHFRPIDSTTPLENRVATFVDPDSSGTFFKRCRRDTSGRCYSPGDSVIALIPPPGPHNGFRTWYAITYEQLNINSADYLDLFIPDTLNCINTDKRTCPNLNHKARNLTGPVEATPGPTENLLAVSVVPNPFRAAEAWDLNGGNEVHFINLPRQARILIYTVAGDLVAELTHDDAVNDFRRWDLKNGAGQDVASGIYMYRVVSEAFTFQDRFIVIR